MVVRKIVIKKYCYTFEYKEVNIIKLTNIGKKETVISTFSDKNMGLYEINKKKYLVEKMVLYLMK